MPAQTELSLVITRMAVSPMQFEMGSPRLARRTGSVTVDDLAPVDEFHIGGRKASEDFLDQLGFRAVR